jgi:hypothetical protein
MALVGLDGLPVNSRNPFAQQKLSDFLIMDGEKVENLVAYAQQLLDQRAPLDVPVALPTGDFCVLTRTIQFLHEHYLRRQDEEAYAVLVRAAAASADAAPAPAADAEDAV